jgi:hypothetical protein
VAIQYSKHRASVAAHLQAHFQTHSQIKDGTQSLGADDALDLPIEVRDLDGGAGQRLRRWVHNRLGRQLGKFGPLIERIELRFGDVHGTKGGVDRSCMVHVILSALPPVVVEAVGETHQKAFDLAAGKAERATRHNLEKHGFATGHKRRHHHDKALDHARAESVPPLDGEASAPDGVLDSEIGEHEPLFGKRAGHGRDQLMLLQQRPEKVRRDMPVDTSKPGSSASDRKAGYGHTGKRNTKLNNAGMTYALEDSTDGRPSRKSSRRSSNRIKPANGLTLRTKSAALSPKSNAARGAGRSH